MEHRKSERIVDDAAMAESALTPQRLSPRSLPKHMHNAYAFFFIRLQVNSLIKLTTTLSYIEKITVFPKGSVTGCDSSLGGGWIIFHFRLFKSILYFVS